MPGGGETVSAEQTVSVYTSEGHPAQATVSLNSADRVVVTLPTISAQLDAVSDVEPFVQAVRLAAELAIDRMKRSM